MSTDPSALLQGRLVGYLAKRLYHATRRHLDDALRNLGLTTSQLAVLVELGDGKPLSPAELARRCYVRPQAMTSLLSGMEAAGLIIRVRNATDGRVVDIDLTDAGRKAWVECYECAKNVEAQTLAEFSAADRQRIRESLVRCIQNLDVLNGVSWTKRRDAGNRA